MKVTTLVMSLSALLLSGCASQMVSDFTPPPGLIFTSYKAPVNLNAKGEKVAATEGGEGRTHYIRDIILTGLDGAWGDCSLAKANGNANLPVGAADYKYLNVLFIYQQSSVRVYNP